MAIEIVEEQLQEHPMIFMGKSGWFPMKIFPFVSTHWQRVPKFTQIVDEMMSLQKLFGATIHLLAL